MSKYYDVDSKVSKMMQFARVVKKKLSFLQCYFENDRDNKLVVSTP
jgi:hypothetical protein